MTLATKVVMKMPRYFKSIGVDQLIEKVEKAVKAYGGNKYSRYCWKDLTPQIKKDLSKCNFDMENVAEEQTDFGPKELIGYHTLNSGLTFRGLCAGGDWEFPVFFIIYWDGQKLRGYIPKRGNPWNTDSGYPYGNPGEGGNELENGINLKKRYPDKFKGWDLEECNEFGSQHVDWDIELIKQDIMDRIKLK